jgi:hypothetical protein
MLDNVEHVGFGWKRRVIWSVISLIEKERRGNREIVTVIYRLEMSKVCSAEG